MKRPADWLWLGLVVLAADLIVRHTLGGPGFVHDLVFVVGAAAISWGITKGIMERC